MDADIENDEVDEAIPATIPEAERTEAYHGEPIPIENDVLGDIIDGTDDDSDEDEDDDDEEPDVKIVLTTGTYANGAFTRRRFTKGANKISRTESAAAPEPVVMSEAEMKLREELNALRCNYHKTAFDVDIDSLEERPWRDPGVDISDYFNYGFTEATWRIYAEKQLRLRKQLEDEGKLETKIIDKPAVAVNKPTFIGRPQDTKDAARPSHHGGGHVEMKTGPMGVAAVTGGGRMGVPGAVPDAPIRQEVSRAPPITASQLGPPMSVPGATEHSRPAPMNRPPPLHHQQQQHPHGQMPHYGPPMQGYPPMGMMGPDMMRPPPGGMPMMMPGHPNPEMMMMMMQGGYNPQMMDNRRREPPHDYPRERNYKQQRTR